jgi:DNA replication protein DnaC
MACALCDDTGWKTIEANGVSRVTRCDCRLQSASFARIKRAGIPSRYLHCTLDNFEAYNESLQRAVKYARSAAAAFPNRVSERDSGLLLIGQPGVGKTHLAVAMLKECIHRGATGVFYTTMDLMVALRQTYASDSGASESEVLRQITEADIVVLDELGRERATEWRDEMLHLIVNARYSNRRPTIFTTNYDVADVDDPDALQVRVGLRVYSRLQEMCESMHLDAADFRERPTNGTVEDLLSLWKMRKRSAHHSPRGADRGRGKAPLPGKSAGQLRAENRPEPRIPRERDGTADLKWPGGRAGS